MRWTRATKSNKGSTTGVTPLKPEKCQGEPNCSKTFFSVQRKSDWRRKKGRLWTMSMASIAKESQEPCLKFNYLNSSTMGLKWKIIQIKYESIRIKCCGLPASTLQDHLGVVDELLDFGSLDVCEESLDFVSIELRLNNIPIGDVPKVLRLSSIIIDDYVVQDDACCPDLP